MPKLKHYFRTVGPTDAVSLLENNIDNRTLRQAAISEYTRAMKDGRWRPGVGTILLSKEGQLVDGQHRLHAVVESSSEQEFLFVEGVDPEVQMVVDTGRKRSLADTLSMPPYNLTSSGSRAAILQVVYRWEQGIRGYRLVKVDTRSSSAQIPELMEFFMAHQELGDLLSETKEVRKSFSITPRVLSLAYWVLFRISEEDAADFFNKLAKGAGLNDGDAIYALRESLVKYFTRGDNKSIDPTYLLGLLFKGWNAYRDGTPTKTLKFNLGGANKEAFPEPH